MAQAGYPRRFLVVEITPTFYQPPAGAVLGSAIVAEAWRMTCECAARVRATAILFQCPARFTTTPPHLTALRSFFARIDRPAGVNLLFEPRGPAWTPAIGRAVSDEIGADHVVD